MKFLRLILLIPFLISCGCSDNNTSVTEPTTDDTVDDTPDPVYTDAELLDRVQQESFKYFWDYAESNSKLARERYHTDEPSVDEHLVTTGGSGFGLMTILVGIERGFVPRAEAVARLNTALTFLENADRFHGAWSHWIDGNTGNVVPFGTADNGGDLVETSFMCQALICVREYFKNGTTEEQALATKADELWKGVDWQWYTRGGQNALWWHWSPTNTEQIDFKLEGYNECLITYIMGASSPTHPVQAAAYHEGWARSGAIVSAATKYGLPVVFNYNGANGNVGPMFWSHYSYLGLNPTGLTDQYADYWTLTQNHAKIMYQYCVANPHQYAGYAENSWGLTASYSRNSNGSTGYSAHSPTNDLGVISPTAALSSFPYTPTESMAALHHFYEDTSLNLIGVAGPYDAFSPQHNWRTPRYLAIDQGTIAPMVENYRSGMLWNLFMNAPEVQTGLQNLGFHSTTYGF
ncbi:beta-glucosidase [Flavobacterium sp. SE-s28]|uniref:Beta-glucosidase n=1 Tax=Flavobacterium silvaticum TaxID=1852020 RepID=A0A972FS24_9FLAO|nr:glucoamylase family protein [Flavobacterium silvaticum]NMH26962.1 beta-glucosidase [Flavobacterium silvaticum]